MTPALKWVGEGGRRGRELSPLDEAINRGPPCVYACKRSHTHVKDPVVHVRLRWTVESTK